MKKRKSTHTGAFLFLLRCSYFEKNDLFESTMYQEFDSPFLQKGFLNVFKRVFPYYVLGRLIGNEDQYIFFRYLCFLKSKKTLSIATKYAIRSILYLAMHTDLKNKIGVKKDRRRVESTTTIFSKIFTKDDQKQFGFFNERTK
jgi:hypothetical protein